VAYLWQVALHSWITGVILYVWMNRMRLPSGRSRRWLLVLLLVMPLITAAIPYRGAREFGEQIAWLNGARVLAIPLFGRFVVGDLVLGLFGFFTALTLWHVLGPSGTGRPRLHVAQGALPQLAAEEQTIVDALGRAQAQWRPSAYAMLAVRLLQSHNPMAMWAFREYRVEVHAACDAIAVEGHDPRILVRILLKMYQTVRRHDGSTRNLLRRRVDVLLAGGPDDAAVPTITIVAIAIFLLLVLPWIV
jgi:hypothetical protein